MPTGCCFVSFGIHEIWQRILTRVACLNAWKVLLAGLAFAQPCSECAAPDIVSVEIGGDQVSLVREHVMVT